ncbi:aminoglycoside phosphotransferase family protein [Alkalihalobacillus sp. 1P02AB]|uniref:aminoglycoside phosphotransferase family protein n=1 Tax=Alkalihalobacillus sp. 1P02AB TaxID=3132260 RepID=UPI0039A74C88
MDQIKEVLLNHFKIKATKVSNLAGGWTALAYKVESLQKTYFLKVFLKNRQSIKKWVELIDYYVPITFELQKNPRLKERISVPIKTLEQEFKFEDQSAFYLLFPYIDGETVGESGLDTNEIVQFAEMISDLHCHQVELDVHPSMIEDFTLPLLSHFKNERMRKEEVPNDVRVIVEQYMPAIQNLMKETEKKAVLLRHNPPQNVFCHTDLHHWNVMRVSNQLVIIDWEGLKLSPVEADLMFIQEQSYAATFMEQYQLLNPCFEMNETALLFFQGRRLLEDVAELLEELLYDNQTEAQREKTLAYFRIEMEKIVQLDQI